MSTTGNDRFSKILFWVGILIIPTILIIQVLVYQPFFGHMDDGSLLRAASGSLLDGVKNFATYGRAFVSSAGFSMLLNFVPYKLAAASGSPSLFLCNALILVLVAILWAFAAVSLQVVTRTHVPVILSAFFLWPFTYELLFFPSLQEKGILLIVPCIIVALSRVGNISPLSRAGAFLLTLYGMAFLTKSQVSLFAPALIFAGFFFAAQRRISRSFAVLNTLLALMMAVTVVILDFRPGSYAVDQANPSIIQNLSNRYVLVMWAVVFTLAIIFVLEKRRLKSSLFPVTLSASIATGFTVFGVRNYWLSIFAPCFAMMIALLVRTFSNCRWQFLFICLTLGATVVWTLYRVPQVFEPLHGIGAFTQGQIAKDLADEGAVIYTSCVEGSGHFNYYAERKWGVTPEFKPLEGDAAGYRFGIPDSGQYVFGDRRLCAAPGEIAEWNVVWASPGDDGFRLYRGPG